MATQTYQFNAAYTQYVTRLRCILLVGIGDSRTGIKLRYKVQSRLGGLVV